MTYRFLKTSIVSLLLLVLLGGCATIIGKSGPETLGVRSTPEQAVVVITDEIGTKIFEGKTPITVSLQKKKGYFSGKKYTVKISKPGYTDQTITVNTRLSGWYIGGNLVLGGLIGWLIVDPATGAMWTLDTQELNVTLEASKQSKEETSQMGVMLLDDVPLSLRSKMVRISQ